MVQRSVGIVIQSLERVAHDEAYHVARRSKHGDLKQITRSTGDLDEARAWCHDADTVVVLVRSETYVVR